MKALRFLAGVFIVFLTIFLHCCIPEPIVLHGDVIGYVTDSETSEPLDSASVELSQSNTVVGVTLTEADGSYHISKIEPGNYEIEASKIAYGNSTEDAIVSSANTTEVHFGLKGIPYPAIPPYLDFGIETTSKAFTISNAGAGTLRYYVITSHDWISVEPDEGQATDETDTIRVTIDKTGISEQKQFGEISISYYVDQDLREEKVEILVNGVRDQDGHYYNVVTIGTQIWMAESLNTGKMINWSFDNRTNNDGEIEKYCYDNISENCEIFGGMYSWHEMMDYNSPEDDPLITIQGICPDGWHIPDLNEWLILFDYAGGTSFAGGNLKDTGTVENGTGMWLAPNEGATNKYGFTALPGGAPYPAGLTGKGEVVQFHVTFMEYYYILIAHNTAGIERNPDDESYNPVNYVRCIKNP